MARILVGMSGGVDSSVTAALLVREGHQVTGVTLKLWDGEDRPDAPWQERSCCKVGIAQHVCDVVEIPHQIVDLRDRFQERVVTDFLDTYLRGDTPNPCIRCNEFVKFAGLLELAERDGYDAVATGHYARIERTSWGSYRLLKGRDGGKDQSYFLYRLKARDLARVRLPLGGMHKTEVMEIARSLGLPADEIAESQEICFVGGGNYADFLQEHRPEARQPGEIVDLQGNRLGHHDGVAFHTIGQRRGLGVALGKRAYVVRTNVSTGQVVIGDNDDLYCGAVEADQLNLLAPLPEGQMQAKVRYRGQAVAATVTRKDDRITVQFDTPQRAAATGQSVVLYQGDTVLGGGVICATVPAPQVVETG